MENVEYTELEFGEATYLASSLFGVLIDQKVGEWNTTFDIRKYQKFLKPWKNHQIDNIEDRDTCIRRYYSNEMGNLTIFARKKGAIVYNRFKDINNYEYLEVGHEEKGWYLYARVNGNSKIETKIKEYREFHE